MLESAKRKSPKKKKLKFEDCIPTLEEILRGGAKLHAFRSGGGLRVVTLEKGKSKGYGEHPSLDEAIRHAVEDYQAGGRPYKEVYGKIYDNYWTGSHAPFEGNLTLMDLLDRHICKGHPMDVGYNSDARRIHVDLNNPYHRFDTPGEVMARALKGETVNWKLYGKAYVSKPFRFPGNGEMGCSTSPGGDSVTAIRSGSHETFLGAVLLAIECVPLIKECLEISSGN